MLLKNKYIIYTGYFLFPWGQAASRRVYGNVKSLLSAGYDVIVASGSGSPLRVEKIASTHDLNSLYHIGLNSCPNQGHSASKKILTLIFESSKKTIDFLDSLNNKPDYIILYGAYTPYLLRLLPWCKKKNIPIIADVVEWYVASSHYFGKFNLSYLNVDFSQKKLFPRCDGIITISSFLDEYFIDKGCVTVKIPPTVDLDYFTKHSTIDPAKKLTLIYAGTPGAGKDLLKNVIDAVLALGRLNYDLCLNILGPSVEEVKKLCKLKNFPTSICILGRIPQQEVPGYVSKADFSLLIRKPLRNAQAGFPTKFVESMASGTPVIANITSDLDKYIIDGVNGLICEDYTVQSLVNVLKRAFYLPKDKILEMHNEAYKMAKENFEYQNFSAELSNFLTRVSQNYKYTLEK